MLVFPDDLVCAPCGTEQLDAWVMRSRHKPSQAETFLLSRARHICLYHCPVLDWCREYAKQKTWDSVVIAGKFYIAGKERDLPEFFCSLCGRSLAA